MAGMKSERLRRDDTCAGPAETPTIRGPRGLYLDRRFPTESGRARFFRADQPPRETTINEFR